MAWSSDHRASSYRFLPRLTIVLAFAVLSWVWASPASAQIQDRSKLVVALDTAAAAYAADSAVAGVSVAVAQEGTMLLKEGYGKASLELNAPTPPDAIYEVGSITKQFTAAAILQLAAKDLIDLGADVTEYLPDYNTRGHSVTVRQLLTHTSGLQDFVTWTGIESLSKQKLHRDSVLSLAEAKSFRFAPGAAMIYSNTGYYLLGLIIEEVSGQSYKGYLEENLLGPAGMKSSHYCDERASVDRKAQGYDWSEKKGLHLRRRWVHQTWIFAAGALCSTTSDLVAWNRALHGGEILSDSMYEKMTAPGHLADGTKLRYGMGLRVYQKGGRSIIGHGGGINGFLSESRYYPQSELNVVVLQNTSWGSRDPESLADSLARLALGTSEGPDSHPYQGDISPFEGRYAGPGRGGLGSDGRLLMLQIKAKNGHLLASEAGEDAEPDTLRHVSDQTWRGSFPDETDRYRFVRAGDRITELRLDEVSGHYVLRRIGPNSDGRSSAETSKTDSSNQ